MRRILVTGGGGFIGSAVVAELESRGDTVSRYDLHDGNDIRDAASLLAAVEGCDAVIHLAGVLGTHELFDTPQLAVDVNVTGSLNVLEACRTHGAGYVGITMPQVFPSIYTATKIASTRLATAYHHTHGIRVSHVRAFNAFGPGQAHGPGHPQKIIPTFATCAWNDEPMPIWGDGTQTVDLIHTSDLSRMLVDAVSFGDDEVFDGGTGISVSVNDAARMVWEHVRKGEPKIQYLPMRRGEEPTTIVAQGEGWDLLGWRPMLRHADMANTVVAYEQRVAA